MGGGFERARWSRRTCGPGAGVFISLWDVCVGLGVSIPSVGLEA